MLYDLRINGGDLIETLWGRPISSAGSDLGQQPGQMHEHSSQEVEKWDCAGDPVPKLIDWARSTWGEDTQKLPNRGELVSVPSPVLPALGRARCRRCATVVGAVEYGRHPSHLGLPAFARSKLGAASLWLSSIPVLGRPW
jgi:hypothetical protein